LVATVVLSVPFAEESQASKRFMTGVADNAELLRGASPGLNFWHDRAADDADAGIVRFDVQWRGLVGAKPTKPRNPADQAYDFSELDAAITAAASRGRKVMLTVYSAPDWAEGPNRPAWARPGTWKPDPAHYGEFARALARRYAGSFPDPRGGGTLPRVRYFEAWNEPNLGDPEGGAFAAGGSWLNPQWRGRRAKSPKLYVRLLNSFTRR